MKKIKNPVTVLDHLTNRMIDDHNMKEKEHPKDETKEVSHFEFDENGDNIIVTESKEVKEGGELFTGGEWKVENKSFTELVIHTDEMTIATVLCIDIPDEEGEANATLISASKDMYLALKAAVSDYKFDGIISEETAKQIRSALKKANPNY